jgi:hypothetical protein
MAKGMAAAGVVNAGSTDVRSFPAGPGGEALECGHVTRGGGQGLVCGWADKLTFGVVVYTSGAASSLSDAASKTNQVRSAIGA